MMIKLIVKTGVTSGFVLFWSKNIGAKGALIMFMKFTPGVNFKNVFTYEFFV